MILMCEQLMDFSRERKEATSEDIVQNKGIVSIRPSLAWDSDSILKVLQQLSDDARNSIKELQIRFCSLKNDEPGKKLRQFLSSLRNLIAVDLTGNSTDFQMDNKRICVVNPKFEYNCPGIQGKKYAYIIGNEKFKEGHNGENRNLPSATGSKKLLHAFFSDVMKFNQSNEKTIPDRPAWKKMVNDVKGEIKKGPGFFCFFFFGHSGQQEGVVTFECENGDCCSLSDLNEVLMTAKEGSSFFFIFGGCQGAYGEKNVTKFPNSTLILRGARIGEARWVGYQPTLANYLIQEMESNRNASLSLSVGGAIMRYNRETGYHAQMESIGFDPCLKLWEGGRKKGF